MANYNIGSLIKRLRKQKGMTQEELAYPLIDRTTLSKIEMGRTTPTNKTLEALFEKLGFYPHNMADFFHDEEMTRAQTILNELDSLLDYRVQDPTDPLVAKVDELIRQLECIDKYAQSDMGRQNILLLKATNAINKSLKRTMKVEKVDVPQEIEDMLLEAIKITIPTFNIKNIPDYYLSKQDRLIINRMTMLYIAVLDSATAIDILYGLKRNFDNHCLDRDEMGRDYPNVIYNLAIYLYMADRLDEAIEICDAGFKVCKETHSLYRLPLILGIKASCLALLGKTEESKQMFTKIIHTLELFDFPDLVANARDQAKILGIKLK